MDVLSIQSCRCMVGAMLSNRKHASVLPPSWYTLYQLTKVDDAVLRENIAQGVSPGVAALARAREHFVREFAGTSRRCRRCCVCH
jgi:hypothetical protein